jgi:hypothetical protein
MKRMSVFTAIITVSGLAAIAYVSAVAYVLAIPDVSTLGFIY